MNDQIITQEMCEWACKQIIDQIIMLSIENLTLALDGCFKIYMLIWVGIYIVCMLRVFLPKVTEYFQNHSKFPTCGHKIKAQFIIAQYDTDPA